VSLFRVCRRVDRPNGSSSHAPMPVFRSYIYDLKCCGLAPAKPEVKHCHCERKRSNLAQADPSTRRSLHSRLRSGRNMPHPVKRRAGPISFLFSKVRFCFLLLPYRSQKSCHCEKRQRRSNLTQADPSLTLRMTNTRSCLSTGWVFFSWTYFVFDFRSSIFGGRGKGESGISNVSGRVGRIFEGGCVGCVDFRSCGEGSW